MCQHPTSHRKTGRETISTYTYRALVLSNCTMKPAAEGTAMSNMIILSLLHYLQPTDVSHMLVGVRK